MQEIPRFDFFFDRHIGVGLRWRSNKDITGAFPLEFSLALPGCTVIIGVGRRCVGEADGTD